MFRQRGIRFGYFFVATISVCIGFYSLLPMPDRSRVKIVTPPETEPRFEQSVHLFHSPQKHLVKADGVVLITESHSELEGLNTRYWCPKTADQWGEVVYQFDLESVPSFELAILDVNLCIFPVSDPESVVEVYVSSSNRSGKSTRLLVLDRHHDDRILRDPIDVTEWLVGAKLLKVCFRLKAHRLMYHPTPNDPIGIAGAQCLRQLARDKCAMALRLY